MEVSHHKHLHMSCDRLMIHLPWFISTHQHFSTRLSLKKKTSCLFNLDMIFGLPLDNPINKFNICPNNVTGRILFHMYY